MNTYSKLEQLKVRNYFKKIASKKVLNKEEAVSEYVPEYLTDDRNNAPDWSRFVPFRWLRNSSEGLSVNDLAKQESDKAKVENLLNKYENDEVAIEKLKANRKAYRDAVYAALRQSKLNRINKNIDNTADNLLRLFYNVPKTASFNNAVVDKKNNAYNLYIKLIRKIFP